MTTEIINVNEKKISKSKVTYIPDSYNSQSMISVIECIGLVKQYQRIFRTKLQTSGKSVLPYFGSTKYQVVQRSTEVRFFLLIFTLFFLSKQLSVPFFFMYL